MEQRGAIMVEMVLILPVLLLLVIGIINFGYLFGQKLSLNQAVREGARQAVVPNTNEGADVNSLGEIRDVVLGSTGGLVTTSQVAVTVGGVAAPSTNGYSTAGGCEVLDVGDPLTVRATYQAPVLMPMPFPGFPSSFTLNSEAVFRCEWTGQ
jgi:Flp pilus assembly protein TadG